MTDGGFWNSNANGWFFRKCHYDMLIELGAQYIKSESNFETSGRFNEISTFFPRWSLILGTPVFRARGISDSLTTDISPKLRTKLKFESTILWETIIMGKHIVGILP